MLVSILAVIALCALINFIFDDFLPLLIIAILVIGGMSMTTMIVWTDNTPDINIQRGIDWINERTTKQSPAELVHKEEELSDSLLDDEKE